jgi:hypothetical protein
MLAFSMIRVFILRSAGMTCVVVMPGSRSFLALRRVRRPLRIRVFASALPHVLTSHTAGTAATGMMAPIAIAGQHSVAADQNNTRQ